MELPILLGNGSFTFARQRVRKQLTTDTFAELPTRVEAGWNTSTVTLRVVGGDEKGSLESETVKYGHVGLGPENDCAGEVQQQL
jgi:hypothetical protein